MPVVKLFISLLPWIVVTTVSGEELSHPLSCTCPSPSPGTLSSFYFDPSHPSFSGAFETSLRKADPGRIADTLRTETAPATWSSIRLDEVVVTGSPLERSTRFQSSRIVEKRELQEESSLSVGEILDGTPGISMQSFGSAPARPVIRGLGGDRLLILQNGERMGDFSATSHDHAIALDPLLIERIEVIRGPASLLYGANALGGVVNLFTDEFRPDAAAGLSGSLLTHGATVNRMGNAMGRFRFRSGNWGVSGHLNLRKSQDLRSPDGPLPGTWSSGYSFGTGWGYFGAGHRTTHSISWMEHQYGIPDHMDEPYESIEIRSHRFNWQANTSLERPQSVIRKVEWRAALNLYDLADMEVVREGNGVTESVEKQMNQQSLSTTLILRHLPLGRVEGAGGWSLQFRNLDVDGEEILTPDAETLSFGGFLYEELSLHPTITLQWGGRLELQQLQLKENRMFDREQLNLDARRDAILSGSAGLNFRPDTRWEAGLLFARAFRVPTLEELYSNAPHQHAGSYQIGDPGLRNELSLGSDLFVRFSDSRLGLELSGYLNQVDHYVMLSPTGEVDLESGLPVFRYEAAHALLTGFEFSAHYRLTREWKLSLESDYVHGSRRDGEWTPLPFMPPLRGGLGVRYEKMNRWGGFHLRGVSRQNRVAPLEEETEGYFLVRLFGGWRAAAGMELTLRIDNLLNVRYRDHLTRIEDRHYVMPGRNLNAAIRWEF